MNCIPRIKRHAGFFLLFFLSACSNIQKQIPHSGLSMDVGSMKRSDYQVMEPMTGISSTQSFLGGLVKVIDDSKFQVMGIRFYDEHWAENSRGMHIPFLNNTTRDRAYYNALSAAPHADTVLEKGYFHRRSGIPLLAEREEVTFTGKSIRLKSDLEVLATNPQSMMNGKKQSKVPSVTYYVPVSVIEHHKQAQKAAFKGYDAPSSGHSFGSLTIYH